MSEKYQQDLSYVETNVAKLLAEFNEVLKKNGLELQIGHFGFMTPENVTLLQAKPMSCSLECWDCKVPQGYPTRCCGIRCS